MGTPRTRASTNVLTRVLISLSSRPRGRTGHERAHRCSPVSCMSLSVLSTPWGHRGHKRAHSCSLVSLSLSLQHCADAQNTSEHIGAHPCSLCPYPCPFNTMGTPRTRASTPVLASVLCVLISVSLDSQNSSEHIGAHWCSVCPYPCLLNSYMFIVIDTIRHLYLSDCQSNKYTLC